jgi:CxxC motif-containing protein (DUF1111 family)
MSAPRIAVSALLLLAAQGAHAAPVAGPSENDPIAMVAAHDPVEAPAGFDGLTNGFLTQGELEAARMTFDDQEEADEGLGPVYNAVACGECHQNPVSGGISQINELRAGKLDGSTFTDHPGGSLINDRAIDASIQERVSGADNVRTFRTSLNTLGDGFIEAIANSTIESIASHQPNSLRGTVIYVPVLEAPGQTRAGRFGWKNQHASLVSFSADAYLNEMGITSPLAPTENTADGRPVTDFDAVPDPEEEATPEAPNGPDIETFAAFMRSTTVPPRDEVAAATPDAVAGKQLFFQVGCANCHVADITTAPAGTVINGGAFVVPDALGNKIIHPYSDFLMHDVGTGDGIVQNGGSNTRKKLRTPPLWGMRTRDRLMHDGESLTRNDAILRHSGQASGVVSNYSHLTNTQKNQLVAFLNSL